MGLHFGELFALCQWNAALFLQFCCCCCSCRYSKDIRWPCRMPSMGFILPSTITPSSPSIVFNCNFNFCHLSACYVPSGATCLHRCGVSLPARPVTAYLPVVNVSSFWLNAIVATSCQRMYVCLHLPRHIELSADTRRIRNFQST